MLIAFFLFISTSIEAVDLNQMCNETTEGELVGISQCFLLYCSKNVVQVMPLKNEEWCKEYKIPKTGPSCIVDGVSYRQGSIIAQKECQLDACVFTKFTFYDNRC